MRPRGLSVIQYLFLLNGLGYLVLLATFFLTLSRDRWRQLVHYFFIVFVALTIIAWVIVNHGRFLITLSAIDKVSEVLLMVTLWLHLHVTQRLTEPATS